MLLLIGCVTALSVAAQNKAPPPGRLLASNCFQCHGTNGNGPGFERLSGESAGEIYEELTEMRRRSRELGIMDAHARGYTDAQLRALAQYLAQLPRSGGGD